MIQIRPRASRRTWMMHIYICIQISPNVRRRAQWRCICVSLPKNILMQSCRKMARNSNADRCMADTYGFPGLLFDAEVLKAVGGWAVVASLRSRGAAWTEPCQTKSICLRGEPWKRPGGGVGNEGRAICVGGYLAARWSWHKARKLRTQILSYCNTK